MKKALSLILMLTMLAVVISGFTAVFAAGLANVSVSGYKTPTENGGLYGKGADDYAHAATGLAKYSVIMTTTDGDFADKKYFVVDINFAPVDNTSNPSITQMSASDNIGNTHIVGKLSAGQYAANRWNHARMIIEDSDYETMMANGKSQKFTLYLNGVLIKEDVQANKHSSLYEKQFKGLRVMFGTDDSVTSRKTYLADFVMSESDTKNAPVVETLTAWGGYTVDGDIVNCLDTVTAGDVLSANSGKNVKIFKNDDFTALVSETDTLAMGNVIVVKSTDNVYKYYTVNSSSYGETVLAQTTSFTDFKLAVVNGAKTEANGLGLKASDDKVVAVKPSPETATDTYFQYIWGTSDFTASQPSSVADYSWDKKCGVFTDYLVIEASIYPVDIETALIVTDYGTIIADDFSSSLVYGAWNRVKVVIDRTHTTSTDNTTKAMVYVNGKPATSSWKSTKSLGETYTTGGKYKAKNAVRFCLRKGESYVDDVRIYEAKALREVEAAELRDGENYDLFEDKIYVPYKGKITLSDLVYDNEKFTVVVYNADMTETVTEVAQDCVVALTGKSDAALELGLTYNDLYAYYTVAEGKEKYELVTSNPAMTGNSGTTEGVTGAVFGNTSGTVKKVTVANGNNFSNTSWKTPNLGMQYLVCAVNVLPDESVKSIMFGTNQHAAMSGAAMNGTHIKSGVWNNIVFVYDITANTSELYVNGVLTFADFKAKYVKGTNDCVRFIINGSTDAVCYIDDFYMYESVYAPGVEEVKALADGVTNGITVNNGTSKITLYSGKTVGDIVSLAEDADVKAYADADCKTVLEDGDTLTDTSVIVITSGEFKAYTVYTVSTYGDNEIMVMGDGYDGVDTVLESDVYFTAHVKDGGALVAAQYDEKGVLVKIGLAQDEGDADLSLNFTPDSVDGSKIKAFLFESAGSIKPLCEPVELNYKEIIDILFLGNSYSMDVSWYLGNIAKADGTAMNISVLNKGGCHLRYHYDNREGNPSELGINFWYNNTVFGTVHNLKSALEAYDWDYVVMQASSTSEGFDNTSEANYQENWAVAVPFAQYIHEHEPNARITIHVTWSMENGYNFVNSAEERDTILQNMIALNERCAREINETLGLEGDDKVFMIYSAGIVDYARHYELAEDVTIAGRTAKAGTNIFDTAYYKTGHIFSDRYINVGDGSMLLNDEDKAEGKISLHRDGFHMSCLGRYLIALNAYSTLTGNTVTGNTFDETAIELDSSPGGYHVTETDKGELAGTCYQTYDALTDEARALCQMLVDEYQE